ncbi:hypothetical protein DTB58_38140 [Streptomyces griseus]|nr:hypothetical protein [Streptomyces griseus]
MRDRLRTELAIVAVIMAAQRQCPGTGFIHQQSRVTRKEARWDLFGYIEGYYNWQGIHSALVYLTLEQAERGAS